MLTFNKMQLLKRRFFAMRNGAVADSLRRSGATYRIIFGLNLPQLVEIAAEFGPDADLARRLRANDTTRESMLIAPMLFPADQLPANEALEWLSTAPTPEVIDIACLKLFKRLPYASQLVDSLAAGRSPMHRYAALRLAANILPTDMDRTETIARKETEHAEPLTQGMAQMILDDIEWRRESAADPM